MRCVPLVTPHAHPPSHMYRIQASETFVSFDSSTQKDIKRAFGVADLPPGEAVPAVDASVASDMAMGTMWDQLALKYEVGSHELSFMLR